MENNLNKHFNEFIDNDIKMGFAVLSDSDKVVPCRFAQCPECLFYKEEDCDIARIRWLAAPAKKTLSNAEKEFLNKLNPKCYIQFTDTEALISNNPSDKNKLKIKLPINTFIKVNHNAVFQIGLLLSNKNASLLAQLFNETPERSI